jgi:hypothetical protein
MDPLEIMRALSIAIASSVLGTSLVGGVFRFISISRHLNEIESTVKTARHVGDIHIECELLVLELEHLIFLTRWVQKVCSRADVLRVRSLSYKVHLDSTIDLGNSVGRSPVVHVDTIDGAVLSAGHFVGAELGVPGVAGVAVLVACCVVSPSPV